MLSTAEVNLFVLLNKSFFLIFLWPSKLLHCSLRSLTRQPVERCDGNVFIIIGCLCVY